MDSAGQDFLDITSADVLKALLLELKGKGIELYVAELHGPVREFAQQTGLLEIIGEDNIFPTVDAAVALSRCPPNQRVPIIIEEEISALNATRETFPLTHTVELVERISGTIRDETKRKRFQEVMLDTIRNIA